MVCRRGGFKIQRHNELRDLEAEMLKPVLQKINGEVLTPDTNRVAGARLDIHARGFWERQGFAFFFMLGFVTRMQNLIEASRHHKTNLPPA